jgi:hypothetical protein
MSSIICIIYQKCDCINTIKEIDMGAACSAHGEVKIPHRILVNMREGNRPFGMLGVDDRIIEK